MLVGSSGTGKSSALRLFFEAIACADFQHLTFHRVPFLTDVYRTLWTSARLPRLMCTLLIPRASTKKIFSASYNPTSDPYLMLDAGKLDSNTREWSDGFFTAILRRISSSPNASLRHWIVFDGDLDPDWVESLNSVLDDNKTLTLPNGERIELLPNVRVIFEVRGIGHGTPATVSRCGMVWFAESTVLVDDLLQRYISRLRQLPLNQVTSEIWGSQASSVQRVNDVQFKMCAVLEPLFVREGFLSAAVKLSMTYSHIMPVGSMQLCSNVMSLLMQFIEDVRAPPYIIFPTLMSYCRSSERFPLLVLSSKMQFFVCFI